VTKPKPPSNQVVEPDGRIRIIPKKAEHLREKNKNIETKSYNSQSKSAKHLQAVKKTRGRSP